jgi:hypothetical protein
MGQGVGAGLSAARWDCLQSLLGIAYCDWHFLQRSLLHIFIRLLLLDFWLLLLDFWLLLLDLARPSSDECQGVLWVACLSWLVLAARSTGQVQTSLK